MRLASHFQSVDDLGRRQLKKMVHKDRPLLMKQNPEKQQAPEDIGPIAAAAPNARTFSIRGMMLPVPANAPAHLRCANAASQRPQASRAAAGAAGS